jgi:hypothetical protein
MQITQRGYIVENDTGIVAGTWMVSGGTFVGFPGEDRNLREALDTIRQDGIPSFRDQLGPNGDIELILSYKRSTNASLMEVGDTLASLGYSIVYADEVEQGGTDEELAFDAEIVRGDFDAWYERRGYVLSKEGRPITMWYLVGNVVEVLPIGNNSLDQLVANLKINGLPLLRRSGATEELTGHSKILVPWVEAFPIEIATVLFEYGYTMVPAMEVESVTKANNWYERGA